MRVDDLRTFFVRPARQGPHRPTDILRRRLGLFAGTAGMAALPAMAFFVAYRNAGVLPWEGGMRHVFAMPAFMADGTEILLRMGWLFMVPLVLFAAFVIAERWLYRRGRTFTTGGMAVIMLVGAMPFLVAFERFQGSVAVTSAVMSKTMDDYRYASDVMLKHGLKGEVGLLAIRLRDTFGMPRGHAGARVQPSSDSR